IARITPLCHNQCAGRAVDDIPAPFTGSPNSNVGLAISIVIGGNEQIIGLPQMCRRTLRGVSGAIEYKPLTGAGTPNRNISFAVAVIVSGDGNIALALEAPLSTRRAAV